LNLEEPMEGNVNLEEGDECVILFMAHTMVSRLRSLLLVGDMSRILY